MSASDDCGGAERAERGVLFADVSDSSGLISELGDERARALILRTLEEAQSAVEEEGGRVVDRIGDEIFVVFPGADEAARGAVAVQLRLEHAHQGGRLPRQLRMRVGFAAGTVLCEGPLVFGETVHLARRVASQAKPLQVLTTSDTLESLSATLPSRVVDRTHLKGQRGFFELRELLWDSNATLTASAILEAPRRDRARGVVVRWRGAPYQAHAGHPVLTVGRDESCDVVVTGRRVSRLHLKVEHRGRSCWLVDQSTNGTLVEADGQRRVYLRREEARLTGAGRILFGPQKDDEEGLEFEVLVEGEPASRPQGR